MKNRNKQTKFPVARIKKIMQKDEEVGKVAQATPVVISKALELFLGMLVEEAAKVTMERNSKRVESYHLKHAIERTDMLDFLKEIVVRVDDPSAGGTIDIEAEKNEAKRRRSQGAPRKRRKKSAAGGAAAGEDEGEGENAENAWIMEPNTAGTGTDGEEDGGDTDRDWE
ncbi:histone-fold-containing protein [Fomitiporia mediterranea MF3/22]|uniref:histone-fold-containing protein n=1 Tax=Fomitiporia mediterranea (strain MF3/22) TaxID=694068 RepID=UPI0004408143|nr:histone-fold-containing protein [Fomitiporia mediterranea MF3/22]EJD00356.1 histone-fold-containing protein [Fomitiporia mediterranea MF3/22]